MDGSSATALTRPVALIDCLGGRCKTLIPCVECSTMMEGTHSEREAQSVLPNSWFRHRPFVSPN